MHPDPDSGPVHLEERRTLRREALLDVLVQSARTGIARRAQALDLSPDGMRLVAQLGASIGDELLLSFRPPRWSRREPLLARALVVRVSRRDDARDLGLRFVAMPETLRAELELALRGTPPPLPDAELWIDADALETA